MKAHAARIFGVVLVAVVISAGGIPRQVTADGPLALTFDCGTVSQIPNSECQALVALYDGTNGPGWTNNNGWLENDAPCSWNGVTCNMGHVTGISLINNQLTGSIPPGLGNLGNLNSLQLWNNQLSGSIPPELGNLTGLQYLDLAYNNQLSGTIPPELGRLTNLLSLRLQSNQLSGAVPPQLGNLTKLQQLWLNLNQLGGPSLPPSLTNLTALQYFYFDTNRLCLPPDAAFQSWFAAIPNRQPGATACTDCTSVTSIPPSECQALVAFYNGTDGPGWISGNNWLWSADPCYWQGVGCDTGHVSRLDLSSNNLSGGVPPAVGELPGLLDLYLESNQLRGRLPQSLTNLHVLSSFYFDTALLCLPDDAAFQAWFGGVTHKSTGGTTCKVCLLPLIGR